MEDVGIEAVAQYEAYVRKGVEWWQKLQGLAQGTCGGPPPRLFWRTSSAPQLEVSLRTMNAQKMELFDAVAAEVLSEAEPLQVPAAVLASPDNAPPSCAQRGPPDSPSERAQRWEFVDYFDLTFPYRFASHYGIHYGAVTTPRINHIDVMAIHTFLNAVCPLP